jgi:hypothetical protein
MGWDTHRGMPVLIRNKTLSIFSLPYPFRGVIGIGEAVVLPRITLTEVYGVLGTRTSGLEISHTEDKSEVDAWYRGAFGAIDGQVLAVGESDEPVGIEPPMVARANQLRLLTLIAAARTVQARPVDAAGWAISFPSIPVPDAAWDFSEETGDVLDLIGSADLSVSGAEQNRNAVGLGADLVDEPCLEMTATTDQLDGGATLGNYADGSLALLLVFRVARNPAAAAYLYSKRDSGNAVGLMVHVHTDGTLRATVGDGDAAVATAVTTQAYCDGAWHAVFVVVDRVADTLQIIGDLGEGEAVACDDADHDNVIHAFFGAWTAGSGNAAKCQLAYAAMWIGTEATGMDAEELGDFWTHGTFPALTLTTSTSVRTTRAEDHLLARWSTGQIPFAASEELEAVAFVAESSAKNWCPRSEDLATGWTASNVTVGSMAADSPDGMQDADTLTATADDGYIRRAITGLTAGVTYTLSVWVMQGGATAVPGTLVIRRGDTHAELESVAFDAAADWERYDVSATLPTGVTSVDVEVGLDDDTDVMAVWGVQLESGAVATSYIPTAAAAVTRAETHPALSVTRATWHAESCRVVLECEAFSEPTAERVLFGVSPEPEGFDTAEVVISATGEPNLVLDDNDSGEISTDYSGTAPTWADGHSIVAKWDSDRMLDYNVRSSNVRLEIDGVESNATFERWIASDGAVRLDIGARYGYLGSSAHFEGMISTFAVTSST